ncbi:sensor histidine kinase, partial [Methyloceanibacter sp.]|uniref:sensor histidine kinase n=1 Tax=Methyloceanibacter sp. TaxID=1965321 RepID=UPI003D6CBD52
IPDEYQASVFERFESRANGSGHRGAGLGLSIVKNLVEMHGGEVVLISTPGRGTKIRARLPLAHEAAVEPEPRRYGSSRAG